MIGSNQAVMGIGPAHTTPVHTAPNHAVAATAIPRKRLFNAAIGIMLAVGFSLPVWAFVLWVLLR